MLHVLFAVEIVIALALVAVILLQRSEGGALGMGGPGGGGGGFGGLFSARGAANILTRTTAFLAIAFIGTALLLAIVAGNKEDGTSVFDNPPSEEATSATTSEPTEDLDAPLSLGDEEDLDNLDAPPPAEDDDGSGDQ